MPEDSPADQATAFPEWMTIEQVAEWLQVSTKTIRRYIESGSLPAVNLGGRAIRIRRQDLEAWLQTRRVEPGLSLRQQARQERREARRQQGSRVARTPRQTTADELARVNVSIAQEDPLVLQCEACGATWAPEIRSNGRMARGAWRCPNGCNST
jgi:excisionase family DNA binding protein